MNRRADILTILEKEGPLGVEAISERGKVPLGTVRAYIPPMRWAGLIRRYRNAKGLFEITDKGREYLKKGGETV
jgi:predicted transcriptional regulator